MPNEHYSAFISEAFIKPIRSVLIVDDDYPTIEDMLDLEAVEAGEAQPRRTRKTWYDAPQRIRNVIDGFRKPERALLVDIHDGANVDAKGDAKIASHLHQSDLLVLDYELDKTRRGDGSRAIEILRGLMSNDHFNLVVVHTSEDLDIVHRQITTGLLSPLGHILSEEDRAKALQLIATREEDDEDVVQDLRESIGLDQYLYFRLRPDSYSRIMMRKHQPFSAFAELADAAEWDEDDRKLMLHYQFAEAETRFSESMNGAQPTHMRWSTSGIKWIKTESDFIAFSQKGEDDNLLNDLQLALEAWNPAPSRLFLAKIRAEIDEYGVVAQTNAMERKHALAHWYSGLLRAGDFERRWRIAESVERHSDQLLRSILPRVERFATDLVRAEAALPDIDARIKEHFDVDLKDIADSDRAKLEHNAFICSKVPEGWHLNTGHILEIAGDYWVCLTPACDLVPGQSDKKYAAFGNRRPFMAVQLLPVVGKALKSLKAQSNLYVFITLGNETKTFGFNAAGNDAAAPVWRTFYAEKHGVFGDDFKFRVAVPQAGKRRLIYAHNSAKVVAQLRYEYALNLIQKLGTTMTRIGLDFVG